MAVDVAEEQLRSGTASSQVITHFLKLGTSREQLEQEKLRRENILLSARAEAIAAAQRNEELFAKALEAFRAYSGVPKRDDDDED